MSRNFLQALSVFALLAAAGADATAQDFVFDESDTPAFVAPYGSADVFHQASSSEIIATPAVQSSGFDRTLADSYAGPGATPLPPLNIPDSKIKCCEDGPRGRQCEVDRYLTKPSGIDPDCLICVKEPYTTTEAVKEQVEVVIYRCFEVEVPFSKEDCEDGTWYRKEGKKVIRRLRPCTTLVNLNYDKQVVRYRDVWYHVRCN